MKARELLIWVRRQRWLGFAVTLLLVTVSQRVAHAEDKAAARVAYIEGSKMYDLTQYQKALDAFTRAYMAYEDPSILFNIAQCHRQLHHKQEAIDFYHSYLRKSPNAPNREGVERLVAELQAAIEKERALAAAPPTGTAAEQKPAEPPKPAPTVVTTQSPERAPVYKKWWLWTIVGVGAAGLAVGLGVGLTAGQNKGQNPTIGTVGPGAGLTISGAF